ncbi:MAG TPA: hypothetical protein VKZ63_16145 [Kofleriaceae bacterium]|nr:hypothetical protein [Kofleriaceae bacterium]
MRVPPALLLLVVAGGCVPSRDVLQRSARVMPPVPRVSAARALEEPVEISAGGAATAPEAIGHGSNVAVSVSRSSLDTGARFRLSQDWDVHAFTQFGAGPYSSAADGPMPEIPPGTPWLAGGGLRWVSGSDPGFQLGVEADLVCSFGPAALEVDGHRTTATGSVFGARMSVTPSYLGERWAAFAGLSLMEHAFVARDATEEWPHSAADLSATAYSTLVAGAEVEVVTRLRLSAYVAQPVSTSVGRYPPFFGGGVSFEFGAAAAPAPAPPEEQSWREVGCEEWLRRMRAAAGPDERLEIVQRMPPRCHQAPTTIREPRIPQPD